MELKSRILTFLDKKLITKLNSIALDVLIRDNNAKFDLMIAAFEEFNVSYSELGIGTNRCAVLIDGYVFKIGMDKAGIADNWSEFSLSQELQPFVTKTYECNGLIAVSEYVTVISKEEFNNNKEEVRQILSHLADSYLLGDVGSVTKNFMNWGYRPDGSLVILDYAYIYRVIGDEMLCGGLLKDESICDGSLEYDINFYKLICPKCRREHSFHEIRRRISKEYEEKEKDVIKQIAYKLTKSSQEINKNETNLINENNPKGENDMSKLCFNNEDDNFEQKKHVEYDESDYEDAIAFMMNIHNYSNNTEEETHEELVVNMDIVDNVVDDINDEEPIVQFDSDDEDEDDGLTQEDIISIINTEDISDLMSEDEDIEENFEVDIPEVENIDTRHIVPIEVADDPFEEEVTENIEVVEEVKVEDVQSEETNSVMIVAPETEEVNINITSDNTSTTVKLEGADTIILTTPDSVDDMRAMLIADIESDQDDNDETDRFSEYDDMYDDEPAGFQKVSKKKRDFN